MMRKRHNNRRRARPRPGKSRTALALFLMLCGALLLWQPSGQAQPGPSAHPRISPELRSRLEQTREILQAADHALAARDYGRAKKGAQLAIKRLSALLQPPTQP